MTGFCEADRPYMVRALELAVHARGVSLPNPMVGAVIVAPDGRIIGEGYTDRYGKGHAEVQAVHRVSEADRHLLSESTIYVTLEPCSHYGKTPPCAGLLVDHHLKRCVVGTIDTFAKVSGRGLEMLRQGGVEVVMAPADIALKCRDLNRIFFTSHALHRPFVTLKWAQSADGFMNRKGPGHPAKISTPVTQVGVHRLRACYDAILVGSGTVLTDRPRLDVRLSGGRIPQPVIIDVRQRLKPTDVSTTIKPLMLDYSAPLEAYLGDLYRQGITSLLVEGGADTLQRFIDSGLWDEARVEVGSDRFGDQGIVSAPKINLVPTGSQSCGTNWLYFYSHSNSADVKNL